jgi:hypothetical protein
MLICIRCLRGKLFSSYPEHKIIEGERFEVSGEKDCKDNYHAIILESDDRRGYRPPFDIFGYTTIVKESD